MNAEFETSVGDRPNHFSFGYFHVSLPIEKKNQLEARRTATDRRRSTLGAVAASQFSFAESARKSNFEQELD